MGEWICAGLVVAALVAWAVWRWRVYGRLFADAHFAEVARGLARVKAAALDRVIVSEADAPRSPADPRTLLTGAGLALVYTVGRVGDRFVHHYSVSAAGGYTAHAVGEMFILFAARLLGVPVERLALGVGRSTVHHAEFALSADEQAAFAARPVPEPSAAEIAEFRREWLEARKGLRWEREP